MKKIEDTFCIVETIYQPFKLDHLAQWALTKLQSGKMPPISIEGPKPTSLSVRPHWDDATLCLLKSGSRLDCQSTHGSVSYRQDDAAVAIGDQPE